MNYYYYLGSLTFPYCSGSYNWIIMDHIFEAPAKQIEAIHQNYTS